MRTSPLVLTAVLALGVQRLEAQNPPAIHDTTAYTLGATALRAQPQATAQVLVHLPPGWQVRVGSCGGGWCAATSGSLAGFLPADSLAPAAPGSTTTAVAPGFGIGVDLSSRLTVGIDAGPHTRLVPEVSYVTARSREFGSNTQIGGYTIDGTDTEIWFGFGVYHTTALAVKPLGAPCFLYFGPRVGMAIAHAEAKVDNAAIPTDATAKRLDVWLGAVVGSELLVSPHFSIGAEGQVTKVFAGTTTQAGVTSSSPGVVQDWVDFQTRGTLVLRMYP